MQQTSTMTFSVVSAPRENQVPGTLLLIVAGTRTIGILKELYLLLASVN